MPEKTTLRPFVKWAGGKRRVLPGLLALAPDSFGTYHEPFLGGGSMLLALQPKKAVVMDRNPQLIDAWLTVRNDPEGLIETLKNLDAVSADRRYYEALRTSYNEGICRHRDTYQSALFVWLNKHCFNGLYRVNSKGYFNVPFNNRAFGPSVDPENIRAVSGYLRSSDIDFVASDFRNCLSRVRAGDFVYLDPPYLPLSGGQDFVAYNSGGFSRADHEAVAELYETLNAKKALVMASNNDTPEAHRLYAAPFTREDCVGTIPRSVKASGETLRAREIVFRNYG